jgi:hypothetical protein
VSEDSQEIEELPGHPDQASTDMAQKRLHQTNCSTAFSLAKHTLVCACGSYCFSSNSDETGKELAHEKKRSRGDHSLAQESG